MERYLTRNGLERSLEQGRTVEQWLGARSENGFRVLKWMSIERENDRGYGTSTILRIREVLDDGGPEFCDVYEFTPYDAEAEEGIQIPFDTPEQALEHALTNLGADPLRFVGEGVVQLEYKDYLETRK